MKSAKDYLKAEVEKFLASAREVTSKAEAENRSLTDFERTSVEKYVADATALKARIQELEDNETLQEKIAGMSFVADSEPSEAAPAKSVGEAFTKSEAFQALKARGLAGKWTTGPIELKAFGDVPGGGVVSIADTVANGSFLQPDVQPGIRGPVEQRLTVADLMAQGTTGQSTVRYLVESLTTNGADTTPEGGVKPASALGFDNVDEPVIKIATFLPVSDEMLEDEPAMQSYLNNRLSLFVRYTEEDQLLNGTGTPPDLSGILDRAIATATSGDIGGANLFDAIMAGITEVRTSGGLEPDAMVIHPTDAASLAIAKATSTGMYFSGGPYAPPSQNPWGLRAVITTRIAQGTVLVGAFREGAQIFRRGGLTVEASNSHSDWFRRDLTAIRVEERLALAVYRPLAFCTVTVGS